MPVAADLFGIAYLDAESFRSSAKLFGVGMSFADYPTGAEGDTALGHVLQAASRAIEAHVGKVFTPGNLTEKHKVDRQTWQFAVNNPPVIEIVSCLLRYAIDGTLTIASSNIYINNQNGYCEIVRQDEAIHSILAAIGTEIDGPVAEIVYKSAQSIPNEIKLAAGYQAAHMINNGFVDAALPANMGAIDLGGLKINNKKGGKSSEERSAMSISPEAARLLQPHMRFVAA